MTTVKIVRHTKIRGKANPYDIRWMVSILFFQIRAISFLILLGEEDVVQDDYFLKTKAAMRQGDYRLQRGKKFYSTAEKEAQRLNIKLQWQLITIPGCGHNPNDEMINVVISSILAQKN